MLKAPTQPKAPLKRRRGSGLAKKVLNANRPPFAQILLHGFTPVWRSTAPGENCPPPHALAAIVCEICLHRGALRDLVARKKKKEKKRRIFQWLLVFWC